MLNNKDPPAAHATCFESVHSQNMIVESALDKISEDLGTCLTAIYAGEPLEAYFEAMLRV